MPARGELAYAVAVRLGGHPGGVANARGPRAFARVAQTVSARLFPIGSVVVSPA